MKTWMPWAVLFLLGILVGGLLPGKYQWQEETGLFELDHESLNTLPIGMASYAWKPGQDSGDARLLWYNQAAREAVGPRYENAVGMTIIELFPALADSEGQKLLDLYTMAAQEKIFVDAGVSTYGDEGMNGRVFWNAVIPSKTGFVAVFIDLHPAPEAYGWRWREGEYEKAFIDGIRSMGAKLEKRLKR